MSQPEDTRRLVEWSKTAASRARATFTTSRLLEFCTRKELVIQTGQPVETWPLVVVKELMDNALDAAEEADVAPRISVSVVDSSIIVADNGPGIPTKTVKALLDFSVRVSSREAYVSPTRGAQGNALKTILAMPYVLDGTDGRVEIEARGVSHAITFKVDAIRQVPVINRVCADSSVKNGTRVTVHWPNSASSILARARDQFLQIAYNFLWLNPHLDLMIEWGEKIEFRPSDPVWSKAKWMPSQPTCPHWYDQQRFERLIAAYVSHERGKQRTVREFVSEFRGLSATAKQAAVLDKIGLARAPLDSLCAGGDFNKAKGTKKWAKQRKAEERNASAAQNRRERLIRRRRVTIKDAAWEVMEKAYMAASNNGRLPATATQVMYAARGGIQERTGQRLDRQYFNQTLLPQYLTEHDVAWDVVFDDRGHFSEPHTKRSFGLGTIAVRTYLSSIGELKWIEPKLTIGGAATCGPTGRFGAVLFVEKEGFIPLFERTRLADRYDIAIMSTKGVSVTACRRLVDAMCEDVPLLVLHDFDKAGFTILGTLQRDTRRYSFRGNPKVIDLGLRLNDVHELGLEPEDTFDRGSAGARRRNLHKNGATEQEIEFLLRQRVELNALPSDKLITWIERKLAEHGIRKIVPDRKTLARAYRAQVHGLEIKRAFADVKTGTGNIKVPRDLATEVAAFLKRQHHASWDAAVAAIAAGAKSEKAP